MASTGYARQRLPDHEATLRDYFFGADRKSSEATVIAQPSASPDQISFDADSAVLPTPGKDNEWLGFCQSAVRLQNGEKKSALKKRTDYAASFAAAGLTTYYCSSKGCLFRGFTSVDLAWRAVMKDDRLGVKCKWPFLVKSHIRQTQVANRQFHYQCPICIFTHGHAEGRVWIGVEIYMEHVSTHRGKDLNPELLQKLNIVNDRTVDDKEEFDLNLIPPQQPLPPRSPSRDSVSVVGSSASSVTGPAIHRTATLGHIADTIWSSRKASSANHDLTRTVSVRSERADSVLSAIPDDPNESSLPWSDGLSVFKMDREEDYLSPDF